MPYERVELVSGLPNPDANPLTAALLSPIDGNAELARFADPNKILSTLSLLRSCIVNLGSYQGHDLRLDMLWNLAPIDRDWLLTRLDRISFGRYRIVRVRCPSESCRETMEIQVDLDRLKPPRSIPADGELRLSGNITRFLAPTVRDLALLAEDRDEDVDAMLRRCMRPDEVSLSDLMTSMSPAQQRKLANVLVDWCTRLGPNVEMVCPSCDHHFSYAHDPSGALVSSLSGSQRTLLSEAHQIATIYHWTHTDILNLRSDVRQGYISVLER